MVLARYLSDLAGRYQGKLLRDRVSHLKTWHAVHLVRWSADQQILEPFLAAGQTLAPDPKFKRDPLLTDHLSRMFAQLNLESTFDVAYAFATSWGHAQLLRSGEFTCESEPKWAPARNVTFANLSTLKVGPLETVMVHLPWTKTTKSAGADVPIRAFPRLPNGDPHPACPVLWFRRHIALNNPQPLEGLFTYTSFKPRSYGRRLALTKDAWSDRTDTLLEKCNLPKMSGHSVRIGGAAQLLMNGVPVKMVQKIGRWASESSFAVYWRYLSVVVSEYTRWMKIAAAPIAGPFVRAPKLGGPTRRSRAH